MSVLVVVPENAKHATRRDPKPLSKAYSLMQIVEKINWIDDNEFSGGTGEQERRGPAGFDPGAPKRKPGAS
jgi:hypothetical protein